MTRIPDTFKRLADAGRKVFIPYITAGDPDLDTTVALIQELERSGADIIELGVPFSDPMADGPVIQRASERSLQHGTTIHDCLEVVRCVRQQSEVPIVIFSYLNPLLALGFAEIGEKLKAAGVDGVLVVDLVPEEAGEFIAQMRASNIETVFLVAPTSTDERMQLIAKSSSGFVYAVSRTGVTGVQQSLSAAAAELAQRVRRFTNLPIAVGFGVSTPDHVRDVWQHADAAVVGSRIVAEIEATADPSVLLARVRELTQRLSAQ